MSSSILIIESDTLLRTAIASALRAIFGEQAGILECDDCEAARRLVEGHGDISMVLCGRDELTHDHWSKLLGISNGLKMPVLLFSAADHYELFTKALSFVANGYVSNLERVNALLELLFERARGRTTTTERKASLELDSELPYRQGAAHRHIRPGLLSARQTEVLRLVKSGYSNKEIANALRISEGTVKVQLKNIFRVLGVRNRTEAAILADRQNGGPEAAL